MLVGIITKVPGSTYLPPLTTFISAMVVLGRLWVMSAGYEFGYGAAAFYVFQLLLTGGFDDSVGDLQQRVIFSMAILIGVTIISILVGLITDTVNSYMLGLSEGRSKVVEAKHTLLLGWNESTTRVICQIAFIQNAFNMENKTMARSLFPWLKSKPSTPVAVAPIVVMNNTMAKSDMEELVDSAFRERGITSMRLGRNVVFRKGDPAKAHDLVRVAAHRATSVLIMMTEVDLEESEESGGTTTNSASIRCVLSLRNVIYSNGRDQHAVSQAFPKDLRVVCQLSGRCPYFHAAAIIGPQDRSCLYPMDLSMYINMLMFHCAVRMEYHAWCMLRFNLSHALFLCHRPSQASAA